MEEGYCLWCLCMCVCMCVCLLARVYDSTIIGIWSARNAFIFINLHARSLSRTKLNFIGKTWDGKIY